MREVSLARKYSKALVGTLGSEKEFNRVKEELTVFHGLLNSDDNLKAGIETPLLSFEQKKVLVDVLKDQMPLSEKTYKFLLVVIEENRAVFLDRMIDLLDHYWYEKEGIEVLKVISAVPLNQAAEEKLVKKLKKAFNSQIVLRKDIDKSLIAGIKIERNSVYYDFSVKGNLKKLKESIISGLSAREN